MTEFHVDNKVKISNPFLSPHLQNKVGIVVDVIDNAELVGGKEIVVDIHDQDDQIDGEWSFIPSELELVA